MYLQNVQVPLHAIVSFLLDVVVILAVAVFVASPALPFGVFNFSLVFGFNLFGIAASVVVAAFIMGLYQREFWGRGKLPSRLLMAFVLSVAVALGLSRLGSLSGNVWTEILLINALAFTLMLINRLICNVIAERMKTSVTYFGSNEGLAALRNIEQSLKPRTFSIGREFSFDKDKSEEQLKNLFGELRRPGINEVVVVGPDAKMSAFATEFLSLRRANVSVTPLSAFVERETRTVNIYDPEAVRQLAFYRAQRTRLSLVLKRLIDVSFALGFLLLTLPVTALVCLMILLLEGRPFFYHQERVGLSGRNFTLYKFRSMSINAEADGVARWATFMDSRVTPIGRILRITRIDEIPQLINVLRGDMTLVGPRPERPGIVASLEKQIPLYASRHSVKPGLTGWAQINFHYGASVEDAVVKTCYDLYYVKNASLLLEIVILLQTVRVILLGEGSR